MPLTRSDVRSRYCRGPPFFCRPPSKQMEPRALLYDARPVVPPPRPLPPPAASPLPPTPPLPPVVADADADAAAAAAAPELPLPLPFPTPTSAPSKFTRLGRCCPTDGFPPALATMSESELAMPPGRQPPVRLVYAAGVNESRELEKHVCVQTKTVDNYTGRLGLYRTTIQVSKYARPRLSVRFEIVLYVSKDSRAPLSAAPGIRYTRLIYAI